MLFRNGRAPHLNRLADRQFTFPPIFGGGQDTNTPAPTSTTPPTRPTPSDPVASKPPASTTEAPPRPDPTSPTSTPPTDTPSTPASTPTGSSTTPPPTESTPPPTVNTPSQSYVYSGPSYSYVYNGGDLPTTTDESLPQSTDVDPPTNSHKTVIYIGIAAGCILGAVLVIAGIMFIVRRLNKRREDEALGDVFDRNSFVRDSMALPDEADESSHPSERNRPRPPTMIDRHMRTANRAVTPPDGTYPGAPDYSNFGPPGGNDNYYGQQQYNGYDQYGGYNQYGNGGYNNQYNGSDGYSNEHYPAPAGFGQHDTPSQSPLGEHFTDTAGAPQYLNHQVGEYPAVPAAAAVAPSSPPKDASRSLTRQPSSGAGVAYPNVAELGRGTSVTPFQASQYAEIGKRLDTSGAAQPNDASQAYARLDRQQGHLGAPQMHNGRPASAYDAEDAYGGI